MSAETIQRYERFLRAIAQTEDEGLPPIFDGVANLDALEWLAEAARDLLDGLDATCPRCSTAVHEGACVGDGDDEDYR